MQARIAGPVRGIRSRSSNRHRNQTLIGGSATALQMWNQGSDSARPPVRPASGRERTAHRPLPWGSVRAIALPVKSLDDAKSRLGPVLSPLERAALTLAMLEDVLDATLADARVGDVGRVPGRGRCSR